VSTHCPTNSPSSTAAGFANFDTGRSSTIILPSEASMALIETEEAARRLARAIASDLSLYNEEKVTEGIKNDNLFDVVEEEIEEGRALFKSRVTPELFQKNFYDRAIIDILVRSKGHVPSSMW
jgi:hypothetical protein